MKHVFGSYLCLYCLLVLSSCGNRKELEKNVSIIYTTSVSIEPDSMDWIRKDTFFTSDYTILVYVGEKECTQCKIIHLPEWSPFFEDCRKISGSLKTSLIWSSNDDKSEYKNRLQTVDFFNDIYIDTNGYFSKKYPIISEAYYSHCLLLDKNHKVILIGNPLKNEKIESLYYKAIGQKLTKNEKD